MGGAPVLNVVLLACQMALQIELSQWQLPFVVSSDLIAIFGVPFEYNLNLAIPFGMPFCQLTIYHANLVASSPFICLFMPRKHIEPKSGVFLLSGVLLKG